MKITKIISVLIIVMSFSTILAAQKEKSSEYRIGAGNLLSISVYDEEDMKNLVRVSKDGTIMVPLLGNISVVGLSAKEAEAKIAKALTDEEYFINPQVNILVMQGSPILILGQVRGPGRYEMKEGLTILGAIAMAGGLTESASANGTTLTRIRDGISETRKIPLGSILKGRSEDILLEPGDTIFVPESAI